MAAFGSTWRHFRQEVNSFETTQHVESVEGTPELSDQIDPMVTEKLTIDVPRRETHGF